MAHKVKCYFCNAIFDADKEEHVKVNARRYAHKSCAENQNKEILQEQKDKDLFYEYVKKIYGKNYNFMLINKQAENFIKQYGYTWSGMAGTLHWFYDINHGSIEEGHGGIGIIPYVYDQAKEYFLTISKAEVANKEIKEVRTPVIFNIQSPRAWQRPPHLLDLED